MTKPFIIEPRIKKLVDSLNGISYIETVSSCEGHYMSPDLSEHRANVLFNAKDHKSDLEALIRLILSDSSPHFPESMVSVNQRYFMIPRQALLRHNWMIDIRPFQSGMIERSAEYKRDVTDKAIERAYRSVERYKALNPCFLRNI